MPDRDWEKELAKVDKQLASLSDEALLTPAGGGEGRKRRRREGRRQARHGASSADTGDVGGTTHVGHVRAPDALGRARRRHGGLAVRVAVRAWPGRLPCGSGRGRHERRVELDLDVAPSGEPVAHAVAAHRSLGPRPRRHRGAAANRLREAGRAASGGLGVQRTCAS